MNNAQIVELDGFPSHVELFADFVLICGNNASFLHLILKNHHFWES